MEKPEYLEDEQGLTQEEFDERQKQIETEVSAEISARERESWAEPKRYFFIFGNSAERDAASRALAQTREYNEVLLQLNGWQEDPGRQDVGLQLNFKQGQEGLRDKLKALFAGLKYQDRTFQILEDYAPDDPAAASRKKVVEMPKRGEPSERREAA
ncbi:MAG: hypothetical protein M1275_02455 [Patescibacteria group bacterium]|nr:hypothetical protein [Patescibacteria group bacterium]